MLYLSCVLGTYVYMFIPNDFCQHPGLSLRVGLGRTGWSRGQDLQPAFPINLPLPWAMVICAHLLFPPAIWGWGGNEGPDHGCDHSVMLLVPGFSLLSPPWPLGIHARWGAARGWSGLILGCCGTPGARRHPHCDSGQETLTKMY